MVSNGVSNSYDQHMLDNDLLFKLLIIGDSAVGKSCLLIRYADDEFSDCYISTIGVDFKIRTIDMDGKVIKLNMWDTAGQERFKTITSTFYRGAHGVMLVFDVTDPETFLNIQSWLETVDKFGGGHVAKLLVGNKCDLKNKRQVTYEEAQELANKLGITYLETSAKSATNVEQAFLTLTAEMKNKFDTGAFKPPPPTILKRGKEIPTGSSKWCEC